MIIPIRCWSCGKPIAHLWEKYKSRTAKGEDARKVLDDLGLERFCCRQQLMGHLDIISTASAFKKH